MDDGPEAHDNRAMAGRYTFPAFATSPELRYMVLWDMHWHVLDCHRLEHAAD